MKTLLRLALILSFAVLPAATFTGCRTLGGIERALTGHDAALTVGIVGMTAKMVVEDAAKLRGAGIIAQEQWLKIAAAYDAFVPIYNAEVDALARAAKRGPDAPASAQLADLFRNIVALYNAAKPPAKP